MDVYGTEALEVAVLQSEFGDDIGEIAAAQMRGDWDLASATRARVVDQILAKGDFAAVHISLLNYSERRLFVTVDVVETVDYERRAPFKDPPTGDLADPGDLVSLWREYEATFSALLQSESIADGECEVFHCLASFAANPELSPYLARFDVGVATHEDALYEVARRHRFGVNRGVAVYLLAHSDDERRLLDLLAEAMFDGDAYVRNNAMRVMGQMIEREPGLPYPLDELVQAMDFPEATDRNKATVAVSLLAKSPVHRNRIRELAIPAALRLLRLQQPINHEPAYELLKTISGETFPAREYDAWERHFRQDR